MGETKEVLNTLFPHFTPNRWGVIEVDGHNYTEIEDALTLADTSPKPKLIVANTVKGKGVSFMENQNIFHYKAPSEEEYQLALEELR